MYNSFQLTIKYLRYLLSAKNGRGHGIHSPFVFDFVRNVLLNQGKIQTPPIVKELRKDLLKNDSIIEIIDYGAGSRVKISSQKRVRDIASTALKNHKYAAMLFRLVAYYQPQRLLELGTSLGLTTSYLALANPSASITTVEGSKSIHEIAQETIHKAGIFNVNLICGPFDEVLPGLLNQKDTISLAYIDGNHRYQPTLDYFNILLENIKEDSILIFDDIHWSREMESAWYQIKNDHRVKCTIDIFFMGFVFFKSEFKAKQCFDIRF